MYFGFNSRRQYSPSLLGSQLEPFHPCVQGCGLLRAQPELSCCSASEAQKVSTRAPRDHATVKPFVLYLTVRCELRVGQCVVVSNCVVGAEGVVRSSGIRWLPTGRERTELPTYRRDRLSATPAGAAPHRSTVERLEPDRDADRYRARRRAHRVPPQLRDNHYVARHQYHLDPLRGVPTGKLEGVKAS